MNTREDLLEEQWDSPTEYYTQYTYPKRTSLSNLFAVCFKYYPPEVHSTNHNLVYLGKHFGYHLKHGFAQLKRALRLGR